MLRLAFDATTQEADLAVDAHGTLRVDGGIETVGIFALFADARPGAQDVTQDPLGSAATQLGGWWAHQLLGPDVRLSRAPGSLLHRLPAYKANAATARRARTWAEQALTWMVEVELADRIEADAAVAGSSLALDVAAYRGDAPVFRQLWET